MRSARRLRRWSMIVPCAPRGYTGFNSVATRFAPLWLAWVGRPTGVPSPRQREDQPLGDGAPEVRIEARALHRVLNKRQRFEQPLGSEPTAVGGGGQHAIRMR